MKQERINIKTIDANALLNLQATFLNHPQLDRAMTAYLTELAAMVLCDIAVIGLQEKSFIKVKAVSGEANIKHVNNVSLLANAMDECFAQSSSVQYPSNNDEQPKITLAHAKLIESNYQSVLSLPLKIEDKIIGVVTLLFNDQAELKADDRLALTRAVDFIAPLIQLKLAAKKPLIYRHWLSQLADQNNQSPATRLQSFKPLALLGLTIILLGFLFIPMSQYIGAPAHLEGLIQRALISPEDSFLQSVYIKPGDRIKKGQILASFADEDLKLSQQQKQSELAQYENAYQASLAANDRVKMMLSQSKVDQANNELLLIDQKLTRSKLIAPFDGVVIEGDLRQHLGAPVKKGDALITVSPLNAFRVIVDVDERDIDLVKSKQTGQLALVSLPDNKINLQVEHITPIATVEDGENYFEIEATLSDEIRHLPLQPGMEGVAKINIGKASLFWKLTHRLFDWLKLSLWSLGL